MKPPENPRPVMTLDARATNFRLPAGRRMASVSWRGLIPRWDLLPAVVIGGLLGLAAANSRAAVPADYKGTPFDPEIYRAEQIAEANRPRLPYHGYERVQTLWSSQDPKGMGWVGKEEAEATIRLDDPDPNAAGKRFIHYHIRMNGYRYAVFGWNWSGPQERPIDIAQYDAVSFSIKISGPKPPQQMFFGVDELEPGPVSLKDYNAYFNDGKWQRITIPVRVMKWGRGHNSARQVRGFAFKTFVWEEGNYDVQLDDFALEHATSAAVTAGAPAPGREPAAQTIPGRVECAFYDEGGEGVAYHDTTAVNILSGVLNQVPAHQRPHATSYEWDFRRDEGVDISYTKDFADLSHPNRFDIGPNQFYIGGAEDGEWCNYTVDVKKAGTYKILAVYGNSDTGKSFDFSLNGKPASVCNATVSTGGVHAWAKAEVGTIVFPEAGRQLLTLHYGGGFNLAFFEFVPAP